MIINERNMKPLLLALILSASATIQAQTFKGVDYLYRATDRAKATQVYGVLTIDSANKRLTFTSKLKVNKKLLKIEISADPATRATYEGDPTPPDPGGDGGGGGL